MLFLLIYFLLFCCRLSEGHEYFLFNVSGEVQKENFKYHSLSLKGTILLELTSFSGDCDLYVSQIVSRPSYEPESNCLQSATCGVDSVIIPQSFKRPIGIGIYGYPSYEVCAYDLRFYKIHKSGDLMNFDVQDVQEIIESNAQRKNTFRESGTKEESSESDTEDEESFLWLFLKYIYENSNVTPSSFLMDLIL